MTETAENETTISWTGDDGGRAASVARAMTAANMGLLDALPQLVGDEIHDRRKRAGMTQAQLALDVGVTRYTIASWERAETIPSNDHLSTLEDALDNAEAAKEWDRDR